MNATGRSGLSAVSERYVDLLLQGDRRVAADLVCAEADRGVGLTEVYLEVFQPALYEIGRRWEHNEISVAEEHYCTAATQLIMSMLYPKLFDGPRNGRTMIAATVAGNLHEIGARMVADFFELDGWDTYFTGSDTPRDSVVAAVVDRRPQLVAVSATLTGQLSAVAQLVQAIDSADIDERPLVLVGGRAFEHDHALAREMGADGTASDARGAVALVHQLLDEATT